MKPFYKSNIINDLQINKWAHHSHLVKEILNENRLEISDHQISVLKKYVEFLLDWNSKINLISRKNQDDVWSQHVLGSIVFLFQFKISQHCNMIDVGTGGGLPGIPIAILQPDIQITLLDSMQKKISAVSDITARLNLKNVKVVCGRAEEISSKKEFSHSYDYVICRAVAPAKDIVRWCKNFLRGGNEASSSVEGSDKKIIEKGSIILLKGGNLEQELSETRIKMKPRSIESYQIIGKGIGGEALMDKKIVVIKP